MAVHPDKSLVATGQTGSKPSVMVWNPENAESIEQKIELSNGSRGVTALAFSGQKGRLLTVVAMDDPHTVMVYDWKKGVKISQGVGYRGVPPQV